MNIWGQDPYLGVPSPCPQVKKAKSQEPPGRSRYHLMPIVGKTPLGVTQTPSLFPQSQPPPQIEESETWEVTHANVIVQG